MTDLCCGGCSVGATGIFAYHRFKVSTPQVHISNLNTVVAEFLTYLKSCP